jgi:hypothetical protein
MLVPRLHRRDDVDEDPNVPSVKYKYDVFVSHSSGDRAVVQQMEQVFSRLGIRCWIAPNDISPGADWNTSIVEGISRSRVMVLVYSASSNESEHVKNELGLAVERQMQIIPFKIEDAPLSDFMKLNLSRRQWQNAFEGPLDKHIERLAGDVQKLLKKKPSVKLESNEKPAEVAGTAAPPRTPVREPALEELQNPYEFDTTATKQTFKGRQTEIDDLLDSIDSGTHSAIFGLQRMGKTSLIEEGLQEALQDRPGLNKSLLLAKIDLQRLGGEQVRYRDFVEAIIEAISTGLPDQGLGRGSQDVRGLTHGLFAPSRYKRGDRTEFFANFAGLLQGFVNAAKKRIVLFIDEFSEVRKVIERNKIALQRNPVRTGNILPHDMYLDIPFMHHLSSLLKDRALKQKFTLVVLVRPFMAEYDDQEELQVLKLMKPIMLYHLDESAAQSLITDPLSGKVAYEEGAVAYLHRLTAGHPYLLQFILKLAVDRIRRERRRTITLGDIKAIEERMISEGPGYDAQFNVVMSDYSVAEVMNPSEAQLGTGVLALISKFGQEQDEGWVHEREIVDKLLEYNINESKTAYLLSQLLRSKIIEESNPDGSLRYRLVIPLLRRRLVKQNMYTKYFRR